MTAVHVRHQLRAAAAALLARVVATDGRIKSNRQIAAPRDDALRLTIRTPEEIAQTIAQDGRQERRIRLRAEVTGRFGNEDEAADRLDDAACDIERLVAANPTLGGLAFDVEYVGAQLHIDAANDRFTGGLAVLYDVTIHTFVGEPETAA